MFVSHEFSSNFKVIALSFLSPFGGLESWTPDALLLLYRDEGVRFSAFGTVWDVT